MQNGSVVRRNRKKHSDIWQFRWWEKTSDGKKIYRRKQIGTVDQIQDLETARKAACFLVPDLNAGMAKSKSVSMTVAQLCSRLIASQKTGFLQAGIAMACNPIGDKQFCTSI